MILLALCCTLIWLLIWKGLTLFLISEWLTFISVAFRRENLLSDLISVLVISFFFLLLTWMKMYGPSTCVRSVYSWWGLSALPPPFSRCPVIPARLSGRALDGLSDEMMTLLWEVIPERGVSYKDCTLLPLPRRSAAPHCQLRRWWLICARWITGSTHWFFQCFIKNIYLQLYPKGADPTHRIPPFLNGAWYKRNNSPCSVTRLMTCNIISETSQ